MRVSVPHSEQMAMLEVSTAAAPMPLTTLKDKHRIENRSLCFVGMYTLRANPRLAKLESTSPSRSIAFRFMILHEKLKNMIGDHNT